MKESVYTAYEDLPLFLNAETVAKLLGISISSSYELMHEKGFPSLRIGSRLLPALQGSDTMAKRRPSGDGMVRKREDGRWEGRIVVGHKKNGDPIHRYVLARTQKELIVKLHDCIEMYRDADLTEDSNMTLGEWLDRWINEYMIFTIRESTLDSYKAMIKNQIKPYLGDRPLSALTTQELQKFYNSVKKKGRVKPDRLHGTELADSMVRGCHSVCRKGLEKSVKERLIRVNSAIGCKLPPKKAREMQVLTQNEILRFLHQAKEEGYYELFLLELGTGMRRGEILALKGSDLNFKTGELHIERQVYIIRAEIIISTPKTKASIRTVILPPSLIKTLAVYKETVNSEWMFPSPTDNGRPRNQSSVRKRLQLILERAGCKKVRFHDLRHTFATMVLERGMDVKTLSATIGHVSSATTLDIYSHITDTMQRQAAVHIDRKIGGTDARMPTMKREERKDTAPVEFTPYKPKIRKPGTSCVTMINDHLYEGRYTPTNAYGKRERHNIYAKTREECEEKLAEMIAEVKAQIKTEKEKMTG